MRVAIINLNTTKRDGRIASALEQGFRAHDDEIWMYSATGQIALEDFEDKVSWAQLVCFIGYRHNKPIWSMFHRAGKDILLVDDAYLHPRRYVRLALNGWQSPWMRDTTYDNERLHKILNEGGLFLEGNIAWGQEAITYAGMSPAYAVWNKLGEAKSYDSVAARRVAGALPEGVNKLIIKLPYEATREFWVGQKAELASATTELIACLNRSAALVSHAQPASVLAMMMGIPVVELASPSVSPLHPFVNRLREQENDLPLPMRQPVCPTQEQRICALSRLAHHQFTLDEIASGAALEGILPHTVKPFETLDGVSDAEHVIRQYQHMHKTPKMFRGGLATAFVKRIASLVERYRSETLLDYGSGKGRQYEEHEQHKQWGEIKPTCYDPGYPPYAIKPEGMFDGVICTDVAEHVPPSGVGDFLYDVIHYARKFVFFCIFTDRAVKYLPDGRNVHLTIKPASWWNTRIIEALTRVDTGSMPKVTQEDDDTFIIRNYRMEIVVFYRSKDTEKESGK